MAKRVILVATYYRENGTADQTEVPLNPDTRLTIGRSRLPMEQTFGFSKDDTKLKVYDPTETTSYEHGIIEVYHAADGNLQVKYENKSQSNGTIKRGAGKLEEKVDFIPGDELKLGKNLWLDLKVEEEKEDKKPEQKRPQIVVKKTILKLPQNLPPGAIKLKKP